MEWLGWHAKLQRFLGFDHMQFLSNCSVSEMYTLIVQQSARQIFTPWKLWGLRIVGSLQEKSALSMEKGCKNCGETLQCLAGYYQVWTWKNAEIDWTWKKWQVGWFYRHRLIPHLSILHSSLIYWSKTDFYCF